jgi:peptidoglycan/LPS O-acetylase OafA/YrhL
MTTPAAKNNNYGALRLLFAYLVIISHSAELADGDRHREPLTMLFGTLSFGTIAVAGFFLISGALISKSFQTTSTTSGYLAKRVLRIYPGFIVAFLASLTIVGALSGATPHLADAPSLIVINLKRLMLLQTPDLPGAFAGTPYASLNGSMWTLAYEFRCYLLVALIGSCMALTRQRAVIVAASLAMIAAGALPLPTPPGVIIGLIGDPQQTLLLTGTFGIGAGFQLYADTIAYRGRYALAAAVILIIAMTSPLLANLGVALAGGYLIFWFALAVRSAPLARIGRDTDISYGVYLYAFPVQKLILWRMPNLDPSLVTVITAAAATLLAWQSWTWIEKPAMARYRADALRRSQSAVPV